jgi:hypothetical protein
LERIQYQKWLLLRLVSLGGGWWSILAWAYHQQRLLQRLVTLEENGGN